MFGIVQVQTMQTLHKLVISIVQLFIPPGVTSWSYILELHPGVTSWSYVLELRPGVTSWSYMFQMYLKMLTHMYNIYCSIRSTLHLYYTHHYYAWQSLCFVNVYLLSAFLLLMVCYNYLLWQCYNYKYIHNISHYV